MGAPSLSYPIIIREELSTAMAGFVSAKWGLVPGWARDGSGRPSPVEEGPDAEYSLGGAESSSQGHDAWERAGRRYIAGVDGDI